MAQSLFDQANTNGGSTITESQLAAALPQGGNGPSTADIFKLVAHS
jgi:hypothetical protein